MWNYCRWNLSFIGWVMVLPRNHYFQRWFRPLYRAHLSTKHQCRVISNVAVNCSIYRNRSLRLANKLYYTENSYYLTTTVKKSGKSPLYGFLRKQWFWWQQITFLRLLVLFFVLYLLFLYKQWKVGIFKYYLTSSMY